ncbi:hypothetical protein E3O44_02295 [Cryobacterium algoricola]|uniref:Uncharacterized protein n=1 Tax=Cryobacterium algoricola TaxID=1259183 RepID=A0ABY2IJH4_9MICO|nr:hypothetical protein [Cryobacterium algoricola]TFB90463.1 hypothetical protein E3O44_02295 [Cryobacterium algoricola]
MAQAADASTSASEPLLVLPTTGEPVAESGPVILGELVPETETETEATSPAAPEATPVLISVPAEAPADEPVRERTLTRRELRALQAAAAPPAEDSLLAAVATLTASRPLSDTAVPVDVPDGIRPPTRRVEPQPIAFMVDVAPSPLGETRPGALHPPVGHWSLDRGEDNDLLPGFETLAPFDQLMNQGVSAGGIPTTTNALILPSIPHQGNTSGPLTSTGEIMITGSIDLPRSLGETGVHPNVYDSSEMDRMLDQLDEGGHRSGIAPVSASRAVSTHASTRGVMAPPKQRGLTLPTVLTVTVGVLAVGVLALFAVGYFLHIF